MFLKIKNTIPWIICIPLLTPMKTEAQFQWTSEGIKAASSTSSQVHMSAVPDGNGGFFLCYEHNYEHNPLGDADIYAQWIDASGNPRWGSSGVIVCSSGGDQKYPTIVGDGWGGAFVAWQDNFSTNIYAQHFDVNGSPSWIPGGIAVCSADRDQSEVKMVSDGENGAILVWKDKRNGSTSDLYAQRIDGSGDSLWTSNGVPVTTASGNQSSHVVMSDGSGGTFVAWDDYRNGFTNCDIYAQHLSNSGSQTWTINGVAVTSLDKNQMTPAIDTTGNKLVIAWNDYRSDVSDIYTQALDQDGTPLWTANGVTVSTANGTQISCRVIRDDEGGAILTWADNRNLYDIYAQRINSSGNPLWTIDGILINQSDSLQVNPEIVSDDSGGAIIVWKDIRSGLDYGLYAQHITPTGSFLWSEDGLPVIASNVEASQNHLVIPDESGGAIALWQDRRNGKSDIYAQLTNDNLSVVHPKPDTLWAGGQSQTIQWKLRTPQTRFHHLTLRLSTSPGDGFPSLIAQDVSSTQYSQSWTPTDINSTTSRIKIQAQDAQDSVLCEYESSEFTIDSDPPDNFDLLTPANGATVNLKPTFQWEPTTDNLSGLDQYELWIDDTRIKEDLQTTEYTLTDEQALTTGPHTWTLKALDHAGLVRQALHTWNITASADPIPPSQFHLLSPTNNTWTSDTNPLFTWEASSDTGSGLMKYQFYLNDQLLIDDIPPSVTSSDSITLTPGTHSWYITAVDSVENSTNSSETWTIRMDNVSPQNFLLNQPEDNQWIGDATPTFAWQATADTGIGLAEFQLRIDGNLKIDHIPGDSSSITLPDGQDLEESTHTWNIVAKDSLGNSRNSQNTFSVGIDITAPHNFTLTLPENNSYVTVDSPDLSWELTSDDVSGLFGYELWIDDTLNKDSLENNTTTPLSPLTEGSHTWFVRALDNAGNIRTTSTFSFVVDSTQPESFALISPLDDDTLHIQQPTFTWHSTTDLISGFDKFQFFLNGQIQRDDLSAQDTSITMTEPLENGTYNWQVKAWDKAGNSRFSNQMDFIIDCNPPQITSPSIADATEDLPFLYTATATDPDQDEINFSFHNTPRWLSPSGNQISGTPVEGTQDTSFLLIASDGTLSDSLIVTINIQNDNDPPVITSPSTAVATEDLPFLYTATATDPDQDEINFSFHNTPGWLSPSGNQISGTPVEGTQDTSFLLIASDGTLSDSMVVTISINAVNDPPIITSPSSATAYEDSLFIYRASATDSDGPYTTIHFIDYPSWLSPSGAEVSGTPLNGGQDTTFKVIASDSYLSDTLTVTLSVIHTNDPPYFDYTFPEPFFSDIDTLRWQLDLDDFASDPDDPDSVLTWSYTIIDTHPISISIHEMTHIATIYAIHIQGEIGITFTVTDPHGAYDTDTLTVNIIKTGIDDPRITDVPDDFVLDNNYPNPFNPTTTIRYGIPRPCVVTVMIYNSLGQEIALLVDKKQIQGSYEVTWDASDFTSGIYFYQIQAGNWRKVRRMILIK